MKRPSQRFKASPWMKYLVPAVLVLLLAALLATVIFVILFAVGVI